MRLDLSGDRVAYRCNLVTVGADGTMVDFAGGHPSNDRPPPWWSRRSTTTWAGTSASTPASSTATSCWPLRAGSTPSASRPTT